MKRYISTCYKNLFLGKTLGIFNDGLNIATCQNLYISLEFISGFLAFSLLRHGTETAHRDP